ncbi:hypothetical protein CEXT_782851 [Caerostris extrusa]|uniref:Uncharacterized protein n=1 Tax=Caerostris extrusa TaxID=172846 RepID=A0AAV4RWX4_CAEEX|nr:hypothetical protein CEXT_782851 [Caerostris extrusa]
MIRLGSSLSFYTRPKPGTRKSNTRSRQSMTTDSMSMSSCCCCSLLFIAACQQHVFIGSWFHSLSTAATPSKYPANEKSRTLSSKCKNELGPHCCIHGMETAVSTRSGKPICWHDVSWP